MTGLLVVCIILLALLGMPLFIALAAGSLLATFNAGLDPALLAVELNRLAASPYLAAIPLFTFAGVVLAAGGAPQRMIQLFNAMIGWLPGGMAAVTLGSCAFFTAFSGASANRSTLTRPLIRSPTPPPAASRCAPISPS